MARIRTIKPSFFQSDDVSVLPLRARLTWIGLWTQCDDQGRTKDHARLIKAAIWPLDTVSLADIEEDLSTLAAHGRIVRYEVDGGRYLEVANWSEHQKINRPTRSTIPAPTLNGHAPLTADSLIAHAGKGKEGKGREGSAREELPQPNSPNPPDPEPPKKCPEHLKTRNPPPCGDCADARKRNDEWKTDQNERIRVAAKCPLHQGELAHNCRPCASEELSPA